MLLPLYYIHFEITILKQIRNIYLEKINYSGSTELYIVLYIIHNILRKVEFGAFLISSPDWLTCLTSIIWLAEKLCNLIINRTQNWCNSWLNCTLVNQSECRICLWFHNEYNKEIKGFMWLISWSRRFFLHDFLVCFFILGPKFSSFSLLFW